MSEVLQEVKKLHDRLDEIEDDVKELKGGEQPDTQLTVEKNGGPGCPEVARIMKEARNGIEKTNGVKTQEAMSILEEMGVERSDEAVRQLLKAISNKFPSYKLKSRNGESYNLQYHRPDDM